MWRKQNLAHWISWEITGTWFWIRILHFEIRYPSSTCCGCERCHFCVWHYYYYWSFLYSAILRFRADSLRSHVILHEWIAFYSAFLNIHRSGVLTALAFCLWRRKHAWLACVAEVSVISKRSQADIFIFGLFVCLFFVLFCLYFFCPVFGPWVDAILPVAVCACGVKNMVGIYGWSVDYVTSQPPPPPPPLLLFIISISRSKELTFEPSKNKTRVTSVV